MRRDGATHQIPAAAGADLLLISKTNCGHLRPASLLFVVDFASGDAGCNNCLISQFGCCFRFDGADQQGYIAVINGLIKARTKALVE
ncbi:hypothetical protein niasHT_002179 [Heterodera trifolii]|uniref:Uncharacterized protein n=1 Tax=Heterodera trifolii TaxID=157864 RepID=A0ABD2MF71_9BILA